MYSVVQMPSHLYAEVRTIEEDQTHTSDLVDCLPQSLTLTHIQKGFVKSMTIEARNDAVLRPV